MRNETLFPHLTKLLDIAIKGFKENKNLYPKEYSLYSSIKENLIYERLSHNDIESIRYLIDKWFNPNSFTKKDRDNLEKELAFITTHINKNAKGN